MNERIKELAEQAGLLPREIGPVVETRHMKKKEQDLDKFAELIVRECALTAGLMEHEGRTGIGAQILDNYGVEE